MNRREVLLATGAGLLVATRPRAQTGPIDLSDIVIDPGVISGYQQTMAQMANFCQNNPGMTVPDGMVDNCINWSNVWAQAVAGSGLGDRMDAILSPSDPNGLTGATLPSSFLANLQQSLAGLGVTVSAVDLAAWTTVNFSDVVAANQDMGGLVNTLNYFATVDLPSLYSTTAPINPLAQARRAVALTYRVPRKYGQHVVIAHDNASFCKGANKADNILSGVVLGAGIVSYFFPPAAPIAGAIAVAHMIPLLTVKIIKVVYSC
jgi:hypothetical protein